MSGTGQATRLTTDTGYFTFFSATNVEVVIKVINGVSDANSAFTDDGQVVIGFLPGAFDVTGKTSVTVDIKPDQHGVPADSGHRCVRDLSVAPDERCNGFCRAIGLDFAISQCPAVSRSVTFGNAGRCTTPARTESPDVCRASRAPARRPD
jgi:hypothetical protein